MMALRNIRWVAVALLVALACACALWGGRDNLRDVAVIREGISIRAHYPVATTIGLVLNYLGGAPATIGLLIGAALVVVRAGKRSAAIRLVAILLGGRLLIEAIKLAVGRPRPALDMHPVITHSLSFPSAHAGNSMIVFGALAIAFASSRHRTSALSAALIASAIVGASRPLLGVHWPSDVIAGWAVGAAWLLLWWPVLSRLVPDEAQHDVVGRHRAPIDQD